VTFGDGIYDEYVTAGSAKGPERWVGVLFLYLGSKVSPARSMQSLDFFMLGRKLKIETDEKLEKQMCLE